jgi:phenylalanyl-tRNA synthetase beta chain
MKFDLAWLNDLLDGAPDSDTLADRLTNCGCLVETRESIDGSEIWEVEVTTNRPDAMNHRGLAREAAVATGAALRPFELKLVEDDEAASSLASIEIAEPDLCSRYVGRVVRGVRMAESPDWLQRRLENCGVRPINAVVDATNYLLLELGQPMHAFDLDRLADRKIVVRRATAREKLTTLDGVSRELDESVLVIADARNAVALAGIMGGADSEIGDETSDILIESAHFDALTVRRASRRLGMHTEASHRFERGADPEMAGLACDAAAALIVGLCGGRVCRDRIDVYPRPWSARRLSFSAAALSRFAGLDIGAQQAGRLLEGLEFSPEVDGDRIAVAVPSHRVDVDRVPDLYEEVIRHVGYNDVPSVLPVLSTAPGRRHANWELVDRAREAAVSTGLVEVMTFSFISEEDDAAAAGLPLCPGDPLLLDNPLAQTQGTMRRSLLPGLLAASRDNLNRGERSLAIFEQGRVFCNDDGSPTEHERLAVVLFGANSRGEQLGFVDLKGIVAALLARTCFPELQWRRGGAPCFDEAEAAVLVTANGRPVGCVGLISGELAGRWDIKRPVYAAELDLEHATGKPHAVQFKALPRFPSVVADMTVEHSTTLSFAELVASVRELAGEGVESVELAARFLGKELPPEVVRTTLRLVYRHSERSLTQEEVNADQAELREKLAERLGVRFA